MKVKELIPIVSLLFLFTHCDCWGASLDLNTEKNDETKIIYCKYKQVKTIKEYYLQLIALYNDSTESIEKGEIDIQGTKNVKERLDVQGGYNYFRQGFTRNRLRINASLLGMSKPEIKVKQGFVVSSVRHGGNKLLCLTGINTQFPLAGQEVKLSYEIMTDFNETNDKYVKLEITRQMSPGLFLGYSIDKRWEEILRTTEKAFIRVKF
ncbi:hypothetical protein KAR91_18565 [Candidatus Pacearchaeota archaeon]|nr:hypothetical protein [Candidatus Pacearchaeota archaeon]